MPDVRRCPLDAAGPAHAPADGWPADPGQAADLLHSYVVQGLLMLPVPAAERGRVLLLLARRLCAGTGTAA